MITDTENFNAWQSVQKQVEQCERLGIITRKDAREVLSEARKSYSEKNMLRASDMLKDRIKK